MDRTACRRRRRAAAVVLPAVAVALACVTVQSALSRGVQAQASLDTALQTLLNQDRAANGLAPLSWNAQLGGIAEGSGYSGCGFAIGGRAQDMVQRNYFSHSILDCGGRNVFDILRAGGVAYRSAGENIGWVGGLSDPTAAARWLHSQFMASPEHRANILNPNFTAGGIGSWSTAPGQTWTGAGTPQSNVIVVVEDFAGLAGSASAAPPPAQSSAAVPPAAASQAAHPAAPAPARPAQSQPTALPAPAPALPETGVVTVAN
jgi:uncharacterized protein YkwD